MELAADPAIEPEETPPRRSWPVRAAAALGRWVDGLELDRWDDICLLGVVILGAGLWVWFGLGPALTVTGVLVLALGAAGARSVGAQVLDPVRELEPLDPPRRPLRGA
ncbi:hypothetical protein Aple_010640 [Acrocarpospora pleiomorpha]|uniref:Uncharacterized protein n=1 Tax=Acrocarpospora pleiomorpha TaxID=90975 RepID=A0A5M3XD96_9ACTN|nr:hypothetical protein [Acrocarpospora pleiomorpha]GES18169.1 hypothetical protein Aple_010640 [Acrocarpospora pleiomorpha]